MQRAQSFTDPGWLFRHRPARHVEGPRFHTNHSSFFNRTDHAHFQLVFLPTHLSIDAIDQYWDNCGWTDDESLQFLNLVEDVMETEYTADSSQLGVREVNFFPPGYTIMSHYTGVPGMGFGNVAAKYAEPFEDDISLNSKVTKINSVGFMDGSGDTVVKYEKNGEIEEIKAKTVLVTASLGVLKAGTIDFV